MTSILIVEDHPTMRDAMRLVLEEDGYEVEDATDGEAGIASGSCATARHRVARLQHPRRLGAEVLEALKGDPTTAGGPGGDRHRDGEEGRQRALAQGADGYITKPFSPLALLRTVERVLRVPRRRIVTANVAPSPDPTRGRPSHPSPRRAVARYRVRGGALRVCRRRSV